METSHLLPIQVNQYLTCTIVWVFDLSWRKDSHSAITVTKKRIIKKILIFQCCNVGRKIFETFQKNAYEQLHLSNLWN